jgi:Fic family protein
MEQRLEKVFLQILLNGPIGIADLSGLIKEAISIPTLNRALAKLVKQQWIEITGKGPTTRYTARIDNSITFPINVEKYFEIDIQARPSKTYFDSNIFEVFRKTSLFSSDETNKMETVSDQFHRNKPDKNSLIYKKEFERLMIELSWKSSQIEGNTYDLIDTEQLLKYGEQNKKYTQEEATMLLNHKTAINYTFDYAQDYKFLTVSKIIDIHALLTQNMGISRNPRKRLVRITGTKYSPLENEFQIIEALEKMCELINQKDNIFEKALAAVLLISYIQPFEDGNKRTARLAANAILMSENLCPLSYRSIDSSEYKKAILLFYELNNISAFKQIFIDQYEFAVNNYF